MTEPIINPRNVDCPDCHGAGGWEDDNGNMVHCPRCNPLTEDDIAEITAVCDAASPGPWLYDVSSVGSFVRQNTPAGASWHVARILMCSDLDEDMPEEASKNGPLIANARTWIPRLLAELKAAKKRLSYTNTYLDHD